MVRLRRLALLLIPTLAVALSGCGQKPPPATGEPYEPSPEMKNMADEMMKNYKSGNVNKAN